MVRVRVVEGYSTAWRDIPYAAPTGSVVDVPRGLVEAAPHLFEVVPPETALHRVEARP
jgi:hypothetical protein